ncbi:serine O-acetyltransferase [Sandaracinus amylolyticus]|uniref:serine O-acetyltransferase n=1 Tax=Sandaracinus amylolyticus TaxID=927083 RepID=UPI001F2FFD09|nr:serine acetyltransferase [Sandaracinus amylolyticus]UJR78426.1 Serine O-acetyltransferase [Sandaracinus amylolyticus]
MIAEWLDGDYRRHGGRDALVEPGFWALGVYRVGRWAMARRSPAGRWAMDRVYRALSAGAQLGLGVAVPREVAIGEGFHLLHGNGVRIHPEVVIGDRVTIMHEVTIGATIGRSGVPRIEDDVLVGAGAKILGPIRVGAGALIAPNSLVISDVPPGATVMGVPARVVPSGTGAPRRDE